MKQVDKQAQQESPKNRVMEAVTAFLTKYRKPILFVIVGIAVVVVALVIVLSVQNARNEAALEAVETLQTEFDEWSSLPEDEREAGLGELSEQAAEIVDAYPRTYAAARARIVEAQALFELERWEEAAGRFSEVARIKPDTYLAPVSLMDAAVALENAGQTDRALELHRRIVDEYDDASAETPRALFAIGRIHESQDRIAEAAEAYRQLIDDYPASSWTNLARNRIITLTVEGRIGG